MNKFLAIILTTFFLLLISNPITIFSESDSLSESQQYRLEQIEKKQATATNVVATSSAESKNQTITFIEGQIIALKESSIFVDTKKGTKFIYTNDTTKFFNLDSSGKKLIGLVDLKINDKIYIIGLSQLTVSGSAKIIIKDQTKVIKNFSVFGRASEITEKNIKLANFTRDDLPNFVLTFSGETKITNSRQEVLKISNLKTTDKILTSGFFDDKNNMIVISIFKIYSTDDKTTTSSSK